MSTFRGSGGARPSRQMSRLTVAVGIGMLVTVASFFISPAIGAGLFVLLWLGTLGGIIYYHYQNATRQDGVPHTMFRFEGEAGERDQGHPADRLRKLEELRSDGLVTEEEYRQKRAEILGEKW